MGDHDGYIRYRPYRVKLDSRLYNVQQPFMKAWLCLHAESGIKIFGIMTVYM